MAEVNMSRGDLETLLAGVSIPYGIVYVLPDGIMVPEYEGYRVNTHALGKYSDKELHALYRVMRLDEDAMRMYDGFEPKCDEQLEFERNMASYIDKKRERVLGEGRLYFASEEITDYINYSILHDIRALKDKRMRVTDFREEMERRKSEKLDEVVRRLAGVQS